MAGYFVHSFKKLAKNGFFAGLFAVLASAWLVWAGYDDVYEPALSMDVFYIGAAQSGDALSLMKSEPSWGHLYTLYLQVLCHFSDNGYTCSLNNIVFITGLTAVLLYTACYVLFGNIPCAVAVAVYYLMLPVSLDMESHNGTFVATLFLAAICFGGLSRDRAIRVLLLALAGFFAAFVRPEYIVSALLFGGIFVFLSLRRPHRQKRLVITLLVLVPVIVMACVFGIPGFTGRSRLLQAFMEHYAHYRYGQSPGLSASYPEVFAAAFGDANSVGAALKANPQAFFGHVWNNVRMLAVLMTGLTFYGSNSLPWYSAALPLFAVLAPVAFVLCKKTARTTFFDHNAFGLVCGLCISTATLIAVLVVAPREYYLPPLVLCVLLFIGAAHAVFWRGRTKARLWAVVLVAVVLARPLSALNRPDAEPVISNLVHFIQKLELQKPDNRQLACWSFSEGVAALVDMRKARYHSAGLDGFLKNSPPDVVVFTEPLRALVNNGNRKAAHNLFKNPAQFGYKGVRLNGAFPTALFVHDSIVCGGANCKQLHGNAVPALN